MKITWLDQAGLLLELDKITVMVDPYLSYSVDKLRPGMVRKRAPEESYLAVKPDVLLLTHNHIDHTDTETLERLLDGCERPITVMGGKAAYVTAQCIGKGHNYVLLAPHSVYSVEGVTFYSVKAAHSDADAVGFIIDDGERTYYISGDTLYNFDVIDDVLDLVEGGVDFAFLPINGVGNNMTARDAADFAYEIDAKCAIPLHYGLYDDVNPEDFDFDDKLVLTPYEAVEV